MVLSERERDTCVFFQKGHRSFFTGKQPTLSASSSVEGYTGGHVSSSSSFSPFFPLAPFPSLSRLLLFLFLSLSSGCFCLSSCLVSEQSLCLSLSQCRSFSLHGRELGAASLSEQRQARARGSPRLWLKTCRFLLLVMMSTSARHVSLDFPDEKSRVLS